MATGLVCAAAVVAVAAPAADAKVWFADMQAHELRWEHRVSTTISGCPGNDSCRAAVQGVTVYLRRGPITRSAVNSRRLRHLGRISSRGTLVFRVPRVAIGRYHLVGRVRAGQRHRLIPVSGTFRIVGDWRPGAPSCSLKSVPLTPLLGAVSER